MLSDAWESMIPETKLAIEDQPRMLVKEPLEVECRKYNVLYASIEAHGHMRSCPGCAWLIWQGKATKPRVDEFRERIGRIIERTLAREGRMERTLAGEARMERTLMGEPGWKHTRTESLRESESERGEELELSEVQGMCLWNPGIKMMSRWRFDIRTHLAVTSQRTRTTRNE